MEEFPNWSFIERPEDLDLTSDIIITAVDMAAAFARSCTDLDAPGARGYFLWSRGNRFFREQLRDPARKEEDVWGYSNRDSILRAIHPSGTFAVTVISGWGGVGDLKKKVRAKNPKGAAVAGLVKRNEQMALFELEEFEGAGEMDTVAIVEDVDVDGIPTWFILYEVDKAGGIHVELSLPIDMHGKYVDTWLVRIPIGTIAPPEDGMALNITPDNPEEGPDFDVTYKGM